MRKTFEVNFEEEQNHTTALSTSTNLGRAATTIATAQQYHKKQDRTNPIPKIKQAVEEKNVYFGQTFEKNEHFTIPNDEITHSLYVGSTGTGRFCPSI